MQQETSQRRREGAGGRDGRRAGLLVLVCRERAVEARPKRLGDRGARIGYAEQRLPLQEDCVDQRAQVGAEVAHYRDEGGESALQQLCVLVVSV